MSTFDQFYKYSTADKLIFSLKMWLEDSFIQSGAFTVVDETSDYYKLNRVHVGDMVDDRVFDGMGPTWIWSDDITDGAFKATGVVIDSVFYPTASTTGTYAHKIDYLRGRVIFDSPISVDKDVYCEYCFVDIGVLSDADKDMIFAAADQVTNYDDIDTNSPNGVAKIDKRNRLWLPSVVISIRGERKRPDCLGAPDYSEFTVQYIVTDENHTIFNRLMDILGNQNSTKLPIINLETVPPRYNIDGSLNDTPLTYGEMIVGYKDGDMIITKSNTLHMVPRENDIYYGYVFHFVDV